MIEFHAPTAADAAWVQPILHRCAYPGADYTFYNMYFWEGYYGALAEVDGFVTQALAHSGQLICLYPAGTGDVMPVIEKLHDTARAHRLRLSLRGVTDETREVLERSAPGRFTFTEYRDSFDYIYTVEELCELHGKKLQAKRNHINRFLQEHDDWHTERVTPENLPLCGKMAKLWYAQHPAGREIDNEKIALRRAMEHFEALSLDGLLLFIGDTVAAFSIGGRMHEQYYDVMFEKAFPDIDGAYPLINREFSRMVADKYPAVRWLNREDDMGEEGLRRAKESYQPTLLLRKYIAEWQEDGV